MNRRQFLKALGAVSAAAILPIGWLSQQDHNTQRIAAHDSPPHIKRRAHLVCSGYNDDRVIQAAIDRGNRVVMDGGTFHLSRTLDFSRSRQLSRITNCTLIGGGIRLA